MTPLRLFLPLRPVAIGIGSGLDLWEAVPPIEQRSLWIIELHCEGYEPGAFVSDLSIFRRRQPGTEDSAGGFFDRLITLQVPAELLDPKRVLQFQRLPDQPAECRVGERICARSSGRIRKLVVVCTNHGATPCPTSSPS